MKRFYGIELRGGSCETLHEGFIIVVYDTESTVMLFGIMNNLHRSFSARIDCQLMFESANSAVELLTALNTNTIWYDDVVLSHTYYSSDDFHIERTFNEDFDLSAYIETSIQFQPHSERL